MLRIIVSIMIMTVFALADGTVLQTGQVKSYDADGNVVTDGSIKDDGYYQAGVTRSYSRDGDIVIDNTTGLQWQDNETIQKSWDVAGTYCVDFSLGDHNNWRLPNIKELETIVDDGKHDPSATENIFQHISLYYWSATTSANSASDAWYVGFDNGMSYFLAKSTNLDIRCVRGGQLKPANLSRDDTNDIVSDSTTGLQWQDDSDAKTTLTGWAAAIDHCENDLALGGYNDWRLPNKNELLTIVDRSRKFPAIDVSVFQNTDETYSSYYWSSTTSTSATGKAWYVRFTLGYSYDDAKSYNRTVRCVRGGEFGHLTCPEGNHLIQGERVCIPGTPDSDPGEYPLIADRNYEQGDINAAGSRTEDPGWQGDYPPLCPPGQMRVQQGAGCVANPECDDADSDGYYAEAGCGTAVDCDDSNVEVNPGASEVCGDYIDNNCDGNIEEGCPCTDADSDGYYAEEWCSTAVDCDDTNVEVNPGASEVCGDYIDNNCDGNIEEGCPCTDADVDGYYAEEWCSTAVDCDDSNVEVNPGASEVCGDMIDNNCDSQVDEGCLK